MSAGSETAHPSAELIAFAANGWAFREAVRAPARELVLATVARALAGTHAEAVEIAARTVPPPARMRAHALGRGAPTTPLHAALLTGIAAGDGSAIATPVVAAAFAVGESVDAAGATVLDAIVAGSEIAARVASALGAGHGERGWDPRGTCGRLGAAIAAARVLGLQRDAMRNAFGVAATAAGGLQHARGTMTAALLAGAAAADGVEAALLARAEFTGAPLALEGRRGLAALMSSSFDPRVLLAGLGETFVFTAPAAPPEPPPPDAVRALVARMERLASVREIVEATLA